MNVSLSNLDSDRGYNVITTPSLAQWLSSFHLRLRFRVELIRVRNMSRYPTNTQHNKHVIITSKLCFDVIITCLLRFVFAGYWCVTEHATNNYQSKDGPFHRCIWRLWGSMHYSARATWRLESPATRLLFTSLLGLTTNKTSKMRFSDHLWGETTGGWQMDFLHKWANEVETIPLSREEWIMYVSDFITTGQVDFSNCMPMSKMSFPT